MVKKKRIIALICQSFRLLSLYIVTYTCCMCCDVLVNGSADVNRQILGEVVIMSALIRRALQCKS
jgi:hypothetical protein